ncbi:hypothetical protein B1R32_10712 [Abditibacterium utsteinense]|uniref:Uncharacterized protein n=1 Tax=Abditibacterium utsteinense TaxID=1960156 RepID=A0A2S8ST67_9BACT|nr:hypothetical protein [Abditibacterium utsteinense]PQV63990.1 hypothetical protein B1R32_10712 [Abditibacterium utsteinense]
MNITYRSDRREFVASVVSFSALCLGTTLCSRVMAQPRSWSPPMGYATYQTIGPTTNTSKLRTWVLPGGNCIINLNAGANASVPAKIVGGDNVVIIGGNIVMPSANNAEISDEYRQALYIKDDANSNDNRVVHIEGVNIQGDADGKALFDGIDLSCPKAIVQIENCRITGVRGFNLDWTEARSTASPQNPYPKVAGMNNWEKDWHGDILQPYGGAKEIRVDGLYGTTDCQALFLKQDGNLATLGERVSLRNIAILQNEPPYSVVTPTTQMPFREGHLFWRSGRNSNTIYDYDTKAPYSANVSNFKVKLRSNTTLLGSVNPDGDFKGFAPSNTTPEPEIDLWKGTFTAGTSTVNWPGLAEGVTAVSTLTNPIAVANTPGTNYVSSGYITTPVNTAISQALGSQPSGSQLPVVTTGTTPVTFQCVYSHSQGTSNITNTYLLVGDAGAGAAGTGWQVKYNPNSGTDQFVINDPSGNGNLITVSNPYTDARGKVQRSSTYPVFNDLVVKWTFTPSSTFTGDKRLYLKTNQNTAYTAFEERGIWRIKPASASAALTSSANSG